MSDSIDPGSGSPKALPIATCRDRQAVRAVPTSRRPLVNDRHGSRVSLTNLEFRDD